ncbi:diaminopimelate epimerase [Campylobacter sp. FMV-PI01]|uniref:Diaminopimelate epimerase n=1 Tax=Campylobacter portucalensis TaxID=2608384 RepID=A0A6L5WL85_9BACT|nr:diaminopimelate epimerase [Campylobacter portucalensis]MSN97142.1 diaminopimelate epimerase [Campylobacter portucalensis]
MRVSKYSASGNDFVIFMSFVSKDRSLLARQICDRFNGIGADGMIVILPSEMGDFKWEFYNSDGSLANMCGNGSRAAFMFAYENDLIQKSGSFLSKAGLIGGKIYEISKNKGVIEVELTKPKNLSKSFIENGLKWHFYDTGVPHLVSFVSDIVSEFDINLAKSMRQKYNANVNFASIKDNKIFVRTFERGVEGETMACGTGMAAVFYAGFCEKMINDCIDIIPKSGEILNFSLKDERINFKGEVLHTFDANFLTKDF